MDGATTSTTKSNSKNLFRRILRILFFRAGKDELSNLGYKQLAVGLICTWIVGMGRYWDDPCAYPLQHLGLGSIFYVFVLAFLLWLFIWFLRPAQWSYRQVLTYVTLTSPPAIIYAIPVERFLSMNAATNANLYFLIIVALWRVALMSQYLRLVARLSWAPRLVGMLFPVTTVITLLFLFDQHRAVFQVMGGFRHHFNPREGADVLLNEVVGFSTVACVPAAICYLLIALFSWREPIRSFCARHKVVASIVSLTLVLGITYGIVRCVYRTPSDRICDEADKSNNEKQEALFTKAIEIDPLNARAFARRAGVEEFAGKYVEAVSDYNRAIELDRNNSSYLVRRADLFEKLGRLSEALVDSKEAKRRETVSSIAEAALPIFKLDGLNNLWDGLLPLGSPHWQMMCLDKAQSLAWVRMPHGALSSMSSWNIEHEIPLLWRLGRLDEALSSCSRLVDWCEVSYGSASTSSEKDGYVEDAALTRAYRMRGYTNYLMGRKDQALLDFEHALAIVKDNPSSLFLKARMLKATGRKTESRDTFLLCEKAITQLSEDSSSKEYVQVLTQIELGGHKESVQAVAAQKDKDSFPWCGYIDQDCNLPATMWEIGKLYQLIDLNTLAQQRFRSALKWMDTHVPEPYSKLDFLLWRTRLYLAIGDKEKATATFQQACKLGFGGAMPSDDLSSIDMNLLVEGQYHNLR